MAEADISIRIRPRAQQDLKVIWRYTVQRWGEAQADLYLQQSDAGIGSLLDFPQIGEDCDHNRASYRKLQINRHLVLYLHSTARIEIVRVLHQSMDVGGVSESANPANV